MHDIKHAPKRIKSELALLNFLGETLLRQEPLVKVSTRLRRCCEEILGQVNYLEYDYGVIDAFEQVLRGIVGTKRKARVFYRAPEFVATMNKLVMEAYEEIPIESALDIFATMLRFDRRELFINRDSGPPVWHSSGRFARRFGVKVRVHSTQII